MYTGREELDASWMANVDEHKDRCIIVRDLHHAPKKFPAEEAITLQFEGTKVCGKVNYVFCRDQLLL